MTTSTDFFLFTFAATPNQSNYMRLVCLSDTHNLHEDIEIPDGDVLIHAGDCTDGGTRNETESFLKWMGDMPHKQKLLVPGNHDFYFEKPENLENIPDSIHLLIDCGINIDGLQFWGSPVTPGLENWAFSKERGLPIRHHWNLMPKNTDILITHTPPYGILDEIRNGMKLGCEELKQMVEIIKPSHHFFGHVHHAAGSTSRSSIRYFNLSSLDEKHRLMHSPVIVDL